MMILKDAQFCGACIYWSGDKEVLGDFVSFDDNSEGRCTNAQCIYHGDTLSADNLGCFDKRDY